MSPVRAKTMKQLLALLLLSSVMSLPLMEIQKDLIGLAKDQKLGSVSKLKAIVMKHIQSRLPNMRKNTKIKIWFNLMEKIKEIVKEKSDDTWNSEGHTLARMLR